MDAQQILHDLTWYEELPVAALRAADENRDRMVPVFLAEIEHWLAADEEARWQANPLFFIFHLLGSWRAKSGISGTGAVPALNAAAYGRDSRRLRDGDES